MSQIKPVHFYIHSTFRTYDGKQAKPHGLEWGMDADSHLLFIPENIVCGDSTMPDLKSASTQRGIIEAYNRWAFAKELDFKCVNDIEKLTITEDEKHIEVAWKPNPYVAYSVTQHDDMVELLKADQAAKGGATAEVWVNGVYEGTLDGEMSLFPIIMAIKRVNGAGTRLAYKRAPGCIRIEKYFRGMIRRDQVFEHVMDNLIALEDPEIIDSKTLIGTATLPDWIMGGQLTSRLHVQETEEGNLKFVRPLYFDDIGTADRHFGLFKGRHDVKISMVQRELDRLRLLAAIPHPYETENPTQSETKHRAAKHSDFGIVGILPDITESSSSSSLVLQDLSSSEEPAENGYELMMESDNDSM